MTLCGCEQSKSRTSGQLYETLLRRSIARGFVTRFAQGLSLFEKRRLIGEDLFGKREEGFRASATSQKSRGHVQRIANEVPQFIADLARIHIFVAQRRKAIFGKIRAMAACQRCELNNLDGRVGIAHDEARSAEHTSALKSLIH